MELRKFLSICSPIFDEARAKRTIASGVQSAVMPTRRIRRLVVFVVVVVLVVVVVVVLIVACARGRRHAGGQFRAHVGQIDEIIGLTANFVGDQAADFNRADYGDRTPLALHRFDQAAKVAIAGQQHDMIDLDRQLP